MEFNRKNPVQTGTMLEPVENENNLFPIEAFEALASAYNTYTSDRLDSLSDGEARDFQRLYEHICRSIGTRPSNSTLSAEGVIGGQQAVVELFHQLKGSVESRGIAVAFANQPGRLWTFGGQGITISEPNPQTGELEITHNFRANDARVVIDELVS